MEEKKLEYVLYSDTDSVIMALFHFQQLRDDRLRELCIKCKDHKMPIHEIVQRFSENDRVMLPLLHAIS